jgi:RNA polymerase sigma factor (TIGR02999 family)
MKDAGREAVSGEDITGLLQAWSGGDGAALEALMPLVYDRLRRLAASFLRQERAGHTLQTGALVNEAYLALVDQTRVQWQDRAHFFALAGRMMRRILIDHARRKKYQKRGGEWQRLPEEALAALATELPDPDLIALDDAMEALEREQPELVRIVEMRFFGGLNVEEMVAVTGLSSTSLNRRWRMARAWLRRELRGGEDGA